MINVTLPMGKFVFQFEAKDDLEVFSKSQHLFELFNDTCCGVCGCEDITPRMRKSKYIDEKSKKEKECEYYEMVCNKPGCWAKLSFGEHMEGGTLFPKRKTADGKFDKQCRGWKKFNKNAEPAPADDVGNDSVPAEEASESQIPFKGKSRGK